MEKWYFCGMKSFFVTLFVALFATILALLLTACRGDDRSGEQPFAPTVVTAPVSVEGGTVTMRGVVTASPNSSLIRCGFYYGNDTIDCDTLLPEAADADVADELAEKRLHRVRYERRNTLPGGEPDVV